MPAPQLAVTSPGDPRLAGPGPRSAPWAARFECSLREILAATQILEARSRSPRWPSRAPVSKNSRPSLEVSYIGDQ